MATLKELRARYRADPQDRPETIAEVGIDHCNNALALSFIKERFDDLAAGRLDYREVWALGLTVPKFLEQFPMVALALIEKLAFSNPDNEVLFRLAFGINEAQDREALAQAQPEAQQAVRTILRSLDQNQAQQMERIRQSCAGTQAYVNKLANRFANREPKSLTARFADATIAVFSFFFVSR